METCNCGLDDQPNDLIASFGKVKRGEIYLIIKCFPGFPVIQYEDFFYTWNEYKINPCSDNHLLFTRQLNLLEGTAPLKEQIRAATARVKQLECMNSLDYATYQEETAVLKKTIHEIRVENMSELSSICKTSITLVLDETQAQLEEAKTKLEEAKTKFDEAKTEWSTLEKKQHTKVFDYISSLTLESVLLKYDLTVSDQIDKRKYMIDYTTKIMDYRKVIKSIESMNPDLVMSEEASSFLSNVGLHQSSTQEDSLKYLAQLPKPPKEQSPYFIAEGKIGIFRGCGPFCDEKARSFCNTLKLKD